MNKEITYADAIYSATNDLMLENKDVYVLGQGVDDAKGTLGTTKDLHLKFGSDRCFDTPVSEEGIAGFAIGSALAGLRPINVHIRMDFLMVCMNQLVNMAAKTSYMFAGKLKVPLVVRCSIGRSWGQGAQHSQALQSIFAHIPGLTVVMPSTPRDAYISLKQSVYQNNPTIFIENRMLYNISEKFTKPKQVSLKKSRILKKGKDITIVGISYMVIESLRARNYLKQYSIDAEIIDPVWIKPIEINTIINSLKKTKNLLVVDNGWLSFGISSEIITSILEKIDFKINFKRLGFADTTCPTTRILENHFYPNSSTIAKSALQLLGIKKNNIKFIESDEIKNFKGPF